MKVAILGSGCTKCKTLEEIVRELVKELELDVDIVKITEINEIIEYGVMLTPGLVIDGEVIVSGRLPSRSEIETHLKSASNWVIVISTDKFSFVSWYISKTEKYQNRAELE